jgi:peptidoglycan hydrolase-like protein with peptidoglycan-binding domain
MSTRSPLRLGASAAAVASLTLAGAGITTALPASAASVAQGRVTATVVADSAQLPTWPVLRQGKNSLWPQVTVRSLQYLLNQRGARLAVDGQFGRQTKAAVVAFQHAHKLPATGVVNGQTWRALIITVKLGSKGQAVRAVQDQINFRNNKNGHTLDVDGIFGLKTQAAVRAFQRAMALEIHGFAVDGIVGPQTWHALVSEALSG